MMRSKHKLPEDALHKAAEEGDLTECKKLLGENPAMLDQFHSIAGKTPLCFALIGKHPEIVKFFQEKASVGIARADGTIMSSLPIWFAGKTPDGEEIVKITKHGYEEALKNIQNGNSVTAAAAIYAFSLADYYIRTMPADDRNSSSFLKAAEEYYIRIDLKALPKDICILLVFIRCVALMNSNSLPVSASGSSIKTRIDTIINAVNDMGELCKKINKHSVWSGQILEFSNTLMSKNFILTKTN